MEEFDDSIESYEDRQMISIIRTCGIPLGLSEITWLMKNIGNRSEHDQEELNELVKILRDRTNSRRIEDQEGEAYERLISDFSNSPKVEEWQKRVGDLNIKLLFSPLITEGSIIYEIQSGDSLARSPRSTILQWSF